ncbi:hypothetical protein [Endozoicomonas euniceicola]|uniref:Transposase IS4-like domain-containing protein n=1 Tax=Endozoicomonas euniceicola TaxID=1234143 RepID=A0ABY6GXD6_9GAMM|nr:hypothetical protein [Endozoicomonas euniceicola]UYM17444.1 hypothetical protein NX720_05860 [Endozoicomonas euniceicola]
MTPEEVDKLPETKMTLWLYRKNRTVSFRSCICRARFLKGRIVRVVWSCFENDKGQTETKLFLSTNPDLKADEVLLAYSLRWPIEPMFQQLKHEFGCKHLWQQKLRTLLRWMHIKMAGYALVQLLTICQNPAAIALAKTAWRNPHTVTAGMLRGAAFNNLPGCWLLAISCSYSQPPTANRQPPKAKSQKPKAKSQKPKAKSQKPKANSGILCSAASLRRALFWIIPQFRIRGCWNRYEQKLELKLPDKNERSDSFLEKAA